MLLKSVNPSRTFTFLRANVEIGPHWEIGAHVYVNLTMHIKIKMEYTELCQ